MCKAILMIVTDDIKLISVKFNETIEKINEKYNRYLIRLGFVYQLSAESWPIAAVSHSLAARCMVVCFQVS